MQVLKEDFLQYLESFGDFDQRSMFGGTGLFDKGAMFAIMTDDALYMRGGEVLNDRYVGLGCEKYIHVKRSSTAEVNYYNITMLMDSQPETCRELVTQTLQQARKEKDAKQAGKNVRLRDLPNMRLTLERILKKAGVPDVATFMDMGPVEVYKRVQACQGEAEIKLLWMFAGAVNNKHWTLLEDSYKESLRQQVS
ncbi:TfoX/Sxy family DNA transformation protein [Thaumasiovibrio subtropicus]|uniref:TfoX/Sxy family DNA transformation protein n=1 Tax=Thaumasiovibrio subtropicus TaxID=1891207 RepID=UPI000B35ED8C|nr:TfoX/Sxy family DNA transformation protein [Thaumasiovibrio subtropicus]